MHCTDVKREVIHLKDNNEWKKDDENHTITKQYIHYLANQNLKHVDTWKKKNVKSNDDCDMFMQIVKNVMNGGEEGATNVNTVVKNLSKVVAVDKKNHLIS